MADEDVRKLDARTDSILSAFETRLAALLAKAQTRTTLRLRQALTIEVDGTVKPTARNLRALQSLPEIFRTALSAEGYDAAVNRFVGSFNGGLPAMEQILAKVAKVYATRQPLFESADQDYFNELKKGVAISLESSLDYVARQARQVGLFAVGGTPYEALAVAVADRLHVALAQAETIAATGISSFYRTVAARGYEQIEESLAESKQHLVYTYYGPGDKLTRPFCEDLVLRSRAKETWTRGQIAEMDNQQLPDVFTTGGGYNCRHQWLVDLDHVAHG